VYDAAEYATEAAAKATPPASAARVAKLRAVRDSSRTISALFFIAVRAVDFTRVTLLKFVPDALSVLRPEAATAARFVPALRFMCVSSVSFVGLQLYWLSLFVRISAASRKRDQAKAKRAAKAKPATPEEEAASEEDA